jgi:hypothetical protein
VERAPHTPTEHPHRTSEEVDEVPDLLHAVDQAALPPAARADLLVPVAGADASDGARLGRPRPGSLRRTN